MSQKFIKFDSPGELLAHHSKKQVSLYHYGRVAVKHNGKFLIGTVMVIAPNGKEAGVQFDTNPFIKRAILKVAELESGKVEAYPVHCYGGYDAMLTDRKVKDLMLQRPWLNPISDASKSDQPMFVVPEAMRRMAPLFCEYLFTGELKADQMPAFTNDTADVGMESTSFGAVFFDPASVTPGPKQIIRLNLDRRMANTVRQVFSVFGHELVHVWQLHHRTGVSLAADPDGGHGKDFLSWIPKFQRIGLTLNATGSMTISAIADETAKPTAYLLAVKQLRVNGKLCPTLTMRRVPDAMVTTEKQIVERGDNLAQQSWLLRSSDRSFRLSTAGGTAVIDIAQLDRILQSSVVLASFNDPSRKHDIVDGGSDIVGHDKYAPKAHDEDSRPEYTPPAPTRETGSDIRERILKSKLFDYNKRLAAEWPSAKPLPVKLTVGRRAPRYNFRITNAERDVFLSEFEPWARDTVWLLAQEFYTQLSNGIAAEVADPLTRKIILMMFKHSAGMVAERLNAKDKNVATLIDAQYNMTRRDLGETFGVDMDALDIPSAAERR